MPCKSMNSADICAALSSNFSRSSLILSARLRQMLLDFGQALFGQGKRLGRFLEPRMHPGAIGGERALVFRKLVLLRADLVEPLFAQVIELPRLRRIELGVRAGGALGSGRVAGFLRGADDRCRG